MLILKQIPKHIEGEDLTVQVDGIAVEFTALNNYKNGTIVVNLAGLEQRKGFDYVEVAPNKFQFVKAPKIGMTLLVDYIKS